MLYSKNLLSGKGKYLFGSILLLFISAVCTAFIDSNDFTISKRDVLLRKIEHELLLQSADSIKGLPVKKIAENEYHISFKNEFTFQADVLVNTTQVPLNSRPFSSDMIFCFFMLLSLIDTAKIGKSKNLIFPYGIFTKKSILNSGFAQNQTLRAAQVAKSQKVRYKRLREADELTPCFWI